MRQQRTRTRKIHKGLGSLLVALLLTVMPVRAFADQAAPAANETSQTSGNGSRQTAADDGKAGEAAPGQTADRSPADNTSTQDRTTTRTSDAPTGSSSDSTSSSSQTTPTTQNSQTTTAHDDTTGPAASDTSSTKDSRSTRTGGDTTIKAGNDVRSDATSGDSEAARNDGDGTATTGKATDTATVLNLANASGVSAGELQTFNCDITQDLQQNITIDPSSLQPLDVCTTGSNPGTTPVQGGLQGAGSLVDILNTIALTATTGKASAHDNDGNGIATTGDATALANVVNIANSAISAQHSFLGVINVYGSLTGNIQVPQSFVDGLVKNGGSLVGAPNTTTIDNNLHTAAQSGNATAAGNDGNGTAKTGDAMTNVTVMNLTGQQVVAKNSLLVFVNVLGNWTGFILPAKGSNTALLGGGLQSASQQTAALGTAGDNTTRITNTIDVAATSGDADASDNDGDGTATSGNARAGINLLNITGSDFKLDDWFGALFINVIGRWVGDFAITNGAAAGDGSQPVQAVQVYRLDQPTDVTPVAAAVASTPQAAGSAVSSGDLQLQSARLTAANTTDGTVLGSSTNRFQTLPDMPNRPVKFDLVSLIAVVAALTLLLMLATAGVRHMTGRRA